MRLLSGLMLGLALQSIPSAGPQVINISYPGSNSAELDAKYDDAMTSTKPRYVVLMAGANNALNEKKFISPEQTRVHLRSMSERAQAGGATLIVVTTHDPDLTRLMQRHRLEDYGNSPPLVRLAAVNAILAALATHQGLSLVDFHAILASEGGSNTDLSTDGVHLTARGYGLLAAAVRAKLPKNISADGTVLCFGDSLTYGQGVRATGAEETPLTYPSQLRTMLKN